MGWWTTTWLYQRRLSLTYFNNSWSSRTIFTKVGQGTPRYLRQSPNEKYKGYNHETLRGSGGMLQGSALWC